MKAAIYSGKQLIGYAELKIGDESMGHVYGVFVATNAYQAIQKTVRKFNNSNERDYSEWESLALSVRLNDGYVLLPHGGIEINDIEELPDEPKCIDIAGIDSEVIIEYFKANPPKHSGS